MSLIERLGLGALHRFDPETAHGLSIKALKMGLAPTPGPVTSARLATQVAGIALPNPVGLAAGFDKNAEALAPLSRADSGLSRSAPQRPAHSPATPSPGCSA